MTPLLELDRVTVLRGGRRALDRVSLTIREGESVAILGANGSGKSTLVKLVYRELYPSRSAPPLTPPHPEMERGTGIRTPSPSPDGEGAGGGAIRIRGKDRWSVQELRSTLGLVANDLQAAIPAETTALDVVIAGFTGQLGIYYDEDRTAERVEAAELALGQADAGAFRDRAFGELSSGEARRVLLARALAHQPSALLLDEPTTSLDLVHAHQLVETIRRQAAAGRSIVLVTHHFHEIVPEIDRVILLHRGQVICDGPRQEVMTSENISRALEARVQLFGDGPYRAEITS